MRRDDRISLVLTLLVVSAVISTFVAFFSLRSSTPDRDRIPLKTRFARSTPAPSVDFLRRNPQTGVPVSARTGRQLYPAPATDTQRAAPPHPECPNCIVLATQAHGRIRIRLREEAGARWNFEHRSTPTATAEGLRRSGGIL